MPFIKSFLGGRLPYYRKILHVLVFLLLFAESLASNIDFHIREDIVDAYLAVALIIKQEIIFFVRC
jgi:hypothetical protein